MELRISGMVRARHGGQVRGLARVLCFGMVAGLLAMPGAALAQPVSVTTLTSSPNPSVFGTAVTLTATVDALGLPAGTGNISFSDDGTQFASPR